MKLEIGMVVRLIDDTKKLEEILMGNEGWSQWWIVELDSPSEFGPIGIAKDPSDDADAYVRESDIATVTAPFLDVVFDGPPSHQSGRFVELELPDGSSTGVGEWIDRGNGLWALRISSLEIPR